MLIRPGDIVERHCGLPNHPGNGARARVVRVTAKGAKIQLLDSAGNLMLTTMRARWIDWSGTGDEKRLCTGSAWRGAVTTWTPVKCPW